MPRWALCEMLEFGYGCLEVVCSSLLDYPREQRIARRQVAQARDVGLDPRSHDLQKGWR
jgi:hypothetical protein